MNRALAGRAATFVAVLLVILLADFALIRLGGADFVGEQTTTGLDREAQREIVRRHREIYHLDESLPLQFGRWIAGLFRGDLGRSIATNEGVTDRLIAAAPDTLILQGTAILLIFGGGILLGVSAAVRAGGWWDRVLSSVLLGLHSVPVFWLGALLILGLASRSGLGIFPLEKLLSRDADALGAGARALDLLHHLVLPATCLVLPGLAVIARHTRAEMIRVLRSEYVLAARAAGHGESTIVYRYALRNALGPVAVLLGGQIPALIGGSVVVETLFNIDGMGRTLFQSTFEHDYPMLQAFFLLTAVATLAGFALSDFLQRLLLPRLRDA